MRVETGMRMRLFGGEEHVPAGIVVEVVLDVEGVGG